tara:strand:+ start:189 stop:392 length:204 start_codon:yes stop_codon:yes gene_type:complete
MIVAKMPMNERDGRARVHDLDNDGYEIWIHHKNSGMEFVQKYEHQSSALAFVSAYNGQYTREISGGK